MKTKKSKRGGKRPGAGRPLKTPGVYRVNINARVHPDTLQIMDDERGKSGLSRGELLDQIFIDKKLKKGKV